MDPMTHPHRYLKGFSLDHKDIKSLVERRAENKSSIELCCFNLRSDDSDDVIIGEGIGSRPVQYLLGKLHTMTSIIEKQGSGWDQINATEFFKPVRFIDVKTFPCLPPRNMKNAISCFTRCTP